MKQDNKVLKDFQVARKQKILESALNFFSEHGYDRTTMDQIADNIEIAKGTIYLYFKNKDDLFLSSVDFAMDSLAEFIHLEVESVEQPLEKMRAMFYAFLKFIDTKKFLANVILHEGMKFKRHAENAYYKILTDNLSNITKILDDGVEQGLFREINTSLVSGVFANLLTGTMYAYMLGDAKNNIDRETDIITDLFLNGLLKRENPIEAGT